MALVRAEEIQMKVRKNIVEISFIVMTCALNLSCNGEHMQLQDLSGGIEDTPTEPNAAGGSTITYDGQVRAIFQKRCAYCHNSSSSIPNWLDYATAFSYRTAIYQKVVVEKSMPMAPYNTAMTDDERKIIGEWVNAGAPKSSDTPGAPAEAATPSPGAPPVTPASGGGSGGGSGGELSGSTPDFQNDILPIFQQRCATCHNATSSIPNWLDYNTAFQYKDQIYQRVFVDKTMPLNNATGMTDDERKKVADWVNAGAPGSSGNTLPDPISSGTPTTTPEPSPTSTPAPNPTPSDGPTPTPSCGTCQDNLTLDLNKAIVAGDSAQVEKLLHQGACINSSFRGGTPLLWAAQSGDTSVAQFLISNGSDPNAQVSADAPESNGGSLANFVGFTPLMFAVKNEDVALIKVLMSHEANTSLKSANGTTALSLAQQITDGAKRTLILQMLGTTAAPTYTKDIQPIFQSRCAMCHNATSSIPNWLDYGTAYQKRAKIYDRVVKIKDMPLGNATGMTDNERALVGKWIDSGAAE